MSVADVAERLTGVLGERGHSPVEASHAGARTLTLQLAEPDLVVIDLVDWEEVDLALAKSLSSSLAAPVSVAYLDSAGETETFVTFIGGKKPKPGASSVGRFASDARVDSLALRGAPVSIPFSAPAGGAASATEALVRANVLPIPRAPREAVRCAPSFSRPEPCLRRSGRSARYTRLPFTSHSSSS